MFDRRTGDTHLISAPSQAVLSILRDRPLGATETELRQFLRDIAPPDDQEQVQDVVREALIELQRIRLVELLDGD